jgi:L-fuculose-phosphate aldolase
MKHGWQNEVFETTMALYEEGLIRTSAGNVSMRCPGSDWIAITPTGVRYDELEKDDIVFLHLTEDRREGDRKPSTEYLMHLSIYQNIPNIGGIIHTHSPYILTFATLGEPIPMITIEGLLSGSNMVPVTKRFSLPGTQDIAMDAIEVFQENPELKALLLMNHGLLTVGQTLPEALSLAESIEREAQVYYQARTLGNPKTITEEQQKAIVANYKRG